MASLQPASAVCAGSGSTTSTSIFCTGQGHILWTPAGSILRQELQNFISGELKKQGYSQVFTPHIGKLELYKTSGHFPYYKESQFSPVIENESLSKVLAENCPCGEVFARLEAVSG